MVRMLGLLISALMILPSLTLGQDPGMPDSAVFGNLDGSPIYIQGPFALVPVWIKNDEDIVAIDIIFGVDTSYGRAGVLEFLPPLPSWDEFYDSVYWDPEFPGFNVIRILGWSDIGGDPNPPLNTDSTWQQIATIRVGVFSDSSLVGDTTCFLALWPGISSVQAGCVIIGSPTDVDEGVSAPRESGLMRIYPNPFNARAVIRYYLREPSNVTLEFFDIAGRRVETLNEGLRNAGEHLIYWDAEELPSGIYFCRLGAGELTQTQRVVLLK